MSYSVKGEVIKRAKETKTYETKAVVLLPYGKDCKSAVEITSNGIQTLSWNSGCSWYSSPVGVVFAPIEAMEEALEMWKEVNEE